MFGMSNDNEVRKFLQALTWLLLDKSIITSEELEKYKTDINNYYNEQFNKWKRGEININGDPIKKE